MTPAELAQELAYRARYLRRLALKQLEDEPGKGPLRNLYNAFKDALVHDQTEAEFADAFAQTITYGLFTARWIGNDQLAAAGERLTRQSALKHIPAASSPFLNELFRSVLSVKLDDQRGRLFWLVDDIADLLDRVNVAYVFGAGDIGSDTATDPVIHFYEPFLAAYDKELKNKRGVFFTPRAVVSYIVRSAHEILRSQFGLQDGLASTDSWSDVAKRINGLEIPTGVRAADPFVCILDPATGTGTFLFECIDVIERTVKDRWCRELGIVDWQAAEVRARWEQYVSKHLIPRLFGYELMMASYAIAHLKLSLKLAETGYQVKQAQHLGLNIYMTNSLEPPSASANPRVSGLFATLGKQAQSADAIKRDKRFTVIVGNPPYSKISSNLTQEMRATIERYRFVDGERIKEKGALQFEINLQDDYVKFVRLCEVAIRASGAGVVGLITNSGYLSTPTLRGMRNSLLETFTSIWVRDEHGHVAKGEAGTDGAPEENVFDIVQGVAVFLGARRAKPSSSAAEVQHSEQYGLRADKYAYLSSHDCANTPFQHIAAAAPFYLFVPHDGDLEIEWRGFAGLNELFPKNSAGIITARDALVIADDKRLLAEQMERFSRSNGTDASIYDEFGFQESKRFDLHSAQKELRTLKDFSEPVRPILHRPFDVRHIFYHSSVVWSMSRPMAAQMRGGRNIALVATRQVTRPQFEHVFVSSHIIEIKACSHDRNTQIFPLFLAPAEGEFALTKGLTANIKPGVLEDLAERIANKVDHDAKGAGGDGVLTPRAFFNYVYAILHAPGFRSRYFQFLRSDFPRIPLRVSAAGFWRLSGLGNRLVQLHLLDGVKPSVDSGAYRGSAKPLVEKLSYSGGTIWLDKATSNGFAGVATEVWSFCIGGYPVCEKWLKDRRGGVLSKSEIEHYEKMLAALRETVRIMKEIDISIEVSGGWPKAFSPAP